MKKILTILTGILLGANIAYGLVTVKTNSVALTLADTCDGTFNDFKFQLAGYNYNVFKFSYDVNLTGVDCVFRITKPIEGTIYLDVAANEITVSTTNVTFAISQTNLPPPGNYYGELLSYQTGTTNYYRSLAQGKLPITWSLYLNDTNYFERYITNAVIGYVYVHPNWVNPDSLWGSTGTVVALSNYVVLIDGNLQTNINNASNALRNAVGTVQTNLNTASNVLNLADGVLQTNINTLSNHVGTTYAKQVDYLATSNDVDTVEALAALHTGQIGAISNDLDTAESAISLHTSQIGAISQHVDLVQSGQDSISNQVDINTTNALLLSGVRAMQGNFNMGGNSITNVASSSFKFSDGQTLTSAKIQLYDLYEGQISVVSNTVDTHIAEDGVTTNTGNWAGTLQTYQPSYFLNWPNFTNTPDTAGEYGITNVWTKIESDARFAATSDMVQAQADISNLEGRTNIWNTGATDASTATNDIATINAARGATNIQAGAADSYSLATRTLTWNTNAAGGGAADASGWSGYAATQNVDLAGYTMSNGSFVGNGTGVTNVNATNATALGGISSTNYARKDIAQTFSGTITGLYGARISEGLAIGPDPEMPSGGSGGINAGDYYGAQPGGMYALNHGAMNRGQLGLGGSGAMYASGIGSENAGYMLSYTATNAGNGSLALCDNSGNITITNNASIILGNGTSLENRSILADVVRARVNFIGNGAGLTNVNGADITGVNATNALALGGIASATWVTSTQTLNTAVGNLNTATGTLNTAVGNLQTATNTLNANKLDKTFTNAASVTAFQITGGSPTNGAAWIATNVNGAGKWSPFIGFSARDTVGVNFTNTVVRNLIWDTEDYDWGNNFNGEIFTVPVNGIYEFVYLGAWARSSGTAPRAFPRLKINSTEDQITYVAYDSVAGGLGTWMINSGLRYMTNGTKVAACISGSAATTNQTYGGGALVIFSGKLIRELP